MAREAAASWLHRVVLKEPGLCIGTVPDRTHNSCPNRAVQSLIEKPRDAPNSARSVAPVEVIMNVCWLS